MTTIKNNPHTAQSADTAKPILRCATILRKARSSRYLSIFALLTLTAALATLPALGDLNYLKNGYKYIEKIPIKSESISASINNEGKNVSNLLDNKKNTEWISWKENIVWAEDYAQPRTFSNIIIDGSYEEKNAQDEVTQRANKTTSVINNNTLSLYDRSAIFRQFLVFDSNSNNYNGALSSLKAGAYTLTMKYRGDVADTNTVTAYFGGWSAGTNQEITIGVPTEWETRTFTFNIEKDITGQAICAIQPRGYKGTLEVDWVQLTHDNTITLPKISEMSVDDYPYATAGGQYDAESLSLENGRLILKGNGGYSQTKLTSNDIRPQEGLDYRVRLTIKGSEAVKDRTLYWCNDTYAKKFDIPAEETEVEIPFGPLEGNVENAYFSLQVGGNTDIIYVKKFVLEHEIADDQWEVDKEINYSEFQNWPYKGDRDYIPALVKDANGNTVAQYSNLATGLSIKLFDRLPLKAGKYTFRIKMTPAEASDVSFMVAQTNGWGDLQTFTVSKASGDNVYEKTGIDLLGDDYGYWIICTPNQKNFTIQDFELIPEYDNAIDILNEGSIPSQGDNHRHQKEKNVDDNDIIYSYPLPETRKFIAAVADGKQLEANHTYVVTYNIKSANEGNVTTLLANYNDLINAYNNNNSWNAWDAVNAAGTSASIKLQPGVTQTVRTSITPNQDLNPAAVVLDLGYNLGAVEVTDLKVCDNYDTSIGTHTENSQYMTGQSGTIVNNSTDNFVTTSFYALTDFNFESGVNYKINVVMKATEPGKLCIKIGNEWDTNNVERIVRWKNFEGTGDWETLTFDFNNPSATLTRKNIVFQVQKQNGGENEDGLNQYSGTVDFQSAMIYHDDQAEELVRNWNFKGVENFPFFVMVYTPQIVDGVMIAQNNDWHQYFVQNGLTLDLNTPYRLYVRLKGVTAKEEAINADLGNWDSKITGKLDIPSTVKENYVDYPSPVVEDNHIIFQIPNYHDKIEYYNFRFVKNPAQNIDRIVTFSELNSVPGGLNNYNNMSLTSDGLEVKPQGIPKPILQGLSLTNTKNYRVDLTINVSHAGRYLVTLGDDSYAQSKEIEISETEKGQDIVKPVYFNAISTNDGAGKLIITPEVYTQSLTVKDATLYYVNPAYDGSAQVGTDYFDIELGDNYIIDKDGKYLFHVGYLNGSSATPSEIEILGGASQGSYKILGKYKVSEKANGNAFFSTADNPLSVNAGDNIKFLRILCTENEGNETGICFQDINDKNNNAYTGSMLQMTRFGIYKQSELLSSDNASNTNWVAPVLSRFQIEALGQRYAYPGATLEDMVGIAKNIEICGELFDNDYAGRNNPRVTYWDTTLPLLKYDEKGVKNEKNEDKYPNPMIPDKNQYIDYSKLTYPEDDDHNRNFDCIDLLLPNLNKLGAVKKLNGNADDDGYYQVVVSMKRSTGTVDEYNNRLIYNVTEEYEEQDVDENEQPKFDENNKPVMVTKTRLVSDESADFKNRANGFPMEISYQGLKINGESKDVVSLGNKTESVITFPEVAAGDSIHFALKINPEWNGVRIFCRENYGDLSRRPGGIKRTNTSRTNGNNGRVIDVVNNPTTEDLRDTRIMRLGEIRAYVELKKINMEDPTARQNYDLLYNNREDFNTRKWVHTQGIISEINNFNSVNGKVGDYQLGSLIGKYMNTGQTWEKVINDYKNYFDEIGLAYPDFSFITNPFDDEDVVPSAGMKRDKPQYQYKENYGEGEIHFNESPRQRSYTILHEVYALPGERVDLYPQSDIWQPEGFNYEEQFVRWYDYLTDKTPKYLYFFSEPKSVIKTESAGFIGGKTLLDHGYRGKGTVASVYFPKASDDDDYSFIETDAEGNKKLKMKDQWVAADFSLAFNTNLLERLSRKNGEASGANIQEPIINFRHLFHIQSGSVFADNNMATAEGNRSYAKSNRRYISTFAGKTFKIRLEQAMPKDDNTKSPFYYRTSDGKYTRVRGYDIRTYKLESTDKLDDFEDKIIFDSRDASLTVLVEENNAAGYKFVQDPNSEFDHIDSYVEVDENNSTWLRNSKTFVRAIKCSNPRPEAGRYLVRLYGMDAEGHVIMLPYENTEGKSGKFAPLVIAEYEVEFIGDENASFMSEFKMNEIAKRPSHRQQHHTEQYLESHYGGTHGEVKAVNFDQYTVLNKTNVIVDKGKPAVDFKRFGFFEEGNGRNFARSKTTRYKDVIDTDSREELEFTVEEETVDTINYTLNNLLRLKLPIRWSDSNYGFGYQVTGDYNMFRLASHSLMTPYMEAASARHDDVVQKLDYNGDVVLDKDNNPIQTENVNGTYDRLFYNTGGKEQGLFYYVNAAADPGEIVKLDFDYLCPGSTIYVSAWVNEFNTYQAETANVIFNFYANVAKDENGEKQILRQEQIHGFATGYVKRNEDDDYENNDNDGGDQGKWMHVYYTFVPDETHADIDKANGEYIDSYYLVLENNCLRSTGADYAVDDVRAYVVAPRVEARQTNSLCERDDKDVKIQVELPLEALEQSLNDLADDNGKVTLQYSILDKTIYDEELENAQKNDENPSEYIVTTEDCQNAFAAAVLHYPHKNIMTDYNNVDYPLSWGEIEFYADYNNPKYTSEDTPITDKDGKRMMINGNYLTIGQYKKEYLKDIYEKCFVFTTQPVTVENNKVLYNELETTHRDYYVVVGNFDTKGLFYNYLSEADVEEDHISKDAFNADVYPKADKDDEGNYKTSDKWNKYDVALAQAYQIGSQCARKAAFSLKGSAQIVIDGVLHETDDNITCCENQRPVIQINLKTKKMKYVDGVLVPDPEDPVENKDPQMRPGSELTENPYLDWWSGSFEEFSEWTSKIKASNGEYLTLWEIIDCFRLDYPDADTWDVPVYGETDTDGKKLSTGRTDVNGDPIYPKNYTKAMREYLKELCATTKVNDQGETVPVEPKLILHKSSYVFPQSATILDKKKSKTIFATAIPPVTYSEYESEDGYTYVICTQPREVKITVSNTSPTLLNGFLKMKYPEDLEDVPLRAGLKQLDKISKGTANQELFIPLRNANPATYDVKNFELFDSDPNVYLVETNDPNYRKLSDSVKEEENNDGSATEEGNSDGGDEDYDGNAIEGGSSDTYNVKNWIAGTITGLTVEFKRDGEDNITFSPDKTPMANIVFSEENATEMRGITFREGYYYKFKFNFHEGPTSMSDQEGYEFPCEGQTVFTIKVVPEYQKWTGGESLNWNNDDNWRRVSKTELFADSDTPYGIKEGLSAGETSDVRFTVNDAHPNTHSYAPLNFTKVIIPAGTTYPQLAAKEHVLKPGGSTPVDDGTGSHSYTWTGTAPKAIPVKNMTTDNYNVGDYKEESNTEPTVYIQYDMAATTYQENNNVYCRPWYANACKEIHFDSNAEILNQQNLDYNKAWVDMEMSPYRWYNVASPLYGVVAGDMYLPKQGARQENELFTDIKFNITTDNDRFHPAVYQRGWDKGTEEVYNLTGNSTNCPNVESVALASTWSHVYNDVAESYAPGMGFSVKTDVTRLTDFAEDGLVKFRFPKADTSYEYYEDKTNGEHKPENGGSIDRSLSGRMLSFSNATASDTTVTLTKAGEGQLFLVGNPFMAHLDMAKFLEKNADVINKKFWILSEGEGQVGVVMDRKTETNMLTNMTVGVESNEGTEIWTIKTDYSRLAPMQGFFVQAKTAGNKTDGNSVSIKFSPDMMAVEPYDTVSKPQLLKAPAYGTRGDGDDIIRVSTPESTAIIRLSAAADKGYAASEDVEMIDDSNQRNIRRIYTVAGTMASAINQTPDADGVEVGLMAPADSVTNVVFNGLALEDYLLYDTATGEMTQLYDGFELEMEGSVSGRYFLTAGIDTAEIEDGTIRIMPVAHEVVVTAPAVCGELTVRVFDTLGREVAKAEGMEGEVRIALDPGIYAVEAIGSEAGRKSAKLRIR